MAPRDGEVFGPAYDDRRIRQLVELANREFANGRRQEAVSYLQQAETEAPRHPVVLNEVAKRKLVAGDGEGALALLRQAVSEEPSNASVWLNLAITLRELKRTDEELSALNQVLAIEPRNVNALIGAASIYEKRGDSRTSAAIYRTALENIQLAPGETPDTHPVLQRAKAVVDANNVALETYLEQRLQDLRMRFADEHLGRFDRCLDTLLLKRRIYRPKPSFMYFPHLPAFEFFDRAMFPWLDSIEAATADIRAELLDVLAEDSAALQPYMTLPGAVGGTWRELNNSRRWSAYFFWHEGVARPENIARCPRTLAALEAWPRCDWPGHAPTAMFSILQPKTRIPPHTGVNNCRLVVHVPLVVPPGCGFRVGAETREWEPGKAFVFDDTIEHEAWNDSDDWRAVLILDIWNPLLTLAEREMVNAVTAGVSEFYGDLPDYIMPPRRTI